MVTPDFEHLVQSHYTSLYRFALSLARTEDGAADLTQQTFYVWASKGHQLRDKSKAKTWLFTTLHRLFLDQRRGGQRYQHVTLEDAGAELPSTAPTNLSSLDAAAAVSALHMLEDAYREPLTLFYLERLSYAEISEVLGIPMGTVMSRLSRGKEQLRRALASGPVKASTSSIVPFDPDAGRQHRHHE